MIFGFESFFFLATSNAQINNIDTLRGSNYSHFILYWSWVISRAHRSPTLEISATQLAEKSEEKIEKNPEKNPDSQPADSQAQTLLNIQKTGDLEKNKIQIRDRTERSEEIDTVNSDLNEKKIEKQPNASVSFRDTAII